jgi:uncharacterized membrane protein YsdA (DUF1294 family)
METEKPTRLYFVALLYSAFPLFVFLVGWCAWFVALPVIGFVLYLLANACKQIGLRSISEKAQVVPVVITGIFSIIWVATTGVWNLGFGRTQDWDVMRNDLLSTLTEHSWPVTHSFEGSSAIWSMRHYLGFYLPGPLAGKVAGDNLSVALTATGVWMFFGVWITLLMLLKLFGAYGFRKYLSLSLFIAFSGLDVIGSRIQGALSLRPSNLIHGGHIEWWAERYQFSSNTTLLHWVPQHALPSWIGALLVIHIVRSRQNLHLLPVIPLFAMLWSPFAAVGITLLALLLLISAGDVSEFFARIRKLPLFIFSLLAIGFTLLLYLQSGASGIPHSLLLAHDSFTHNIKMLIEFISLEFGIVAGLTGILLRHKIRENLIISFGLILILMIVVGWYNDFAMRVSPALLVVILVNACEAIFTTPKRGSHRLVQMALVGVLTLGAITPLFEFVTRYQTPFTSLQSPCIDTGCGSDLTSSRLRNYNWTDQGVIFLRKAGT